MIRLSALTVSLAIALLAALPIALPAAAQATPGAGAPVMSQQPTVILVSAIGPAMRVPGSDGLDHIEYNLLITNAISSPVILTTIEAATPEGEPLLTLEGDALASATQPVSATGEPVAEIPPSGTVSVIMDVAVAPGEAPQRITHRVASTLPADARQFFQTLGEEVTGPEIEVDPRQPVVLAAPVHGAGWLNVNSCCDPSSVHRSVRLAVAGQRLALTETFAIDWILSEGELAFTGDGSQNAQWFGYGQEITSATAGTVVAVRDGQPEETPFMPTQFVDDVAAVGGNHVTVEVEPGVYAFYAHLQPGSVAVAIGDEVAVGDAIGLLGNSGNSTAPHLHFGLLDAPDPLTATSLPMVFDAYTLLGAVDPATFGVASGEATPVTTDLSSPQRETLPLNWTVTEFA